MEHQKWIKGYEQDFQRLAEEVGDLRYDSLAEFLELLAKKIKQDANNDRDRGRYHLSEFLYETKDKLAKAADSAGYAWKICEPYMPDANDTEGSEKE